MIGIGTLRNRTHFIPFALMVGCWNRFFRGGSVKLVGWVWFGRIGTGGGEVLEASVGLT